MLYAAGATTSGFGWVRRWNGTAWLTMPSGALYEVLSLTVHDDGAGPQLYMLSLGGVLKLDAGAWTPIVGGEPPLFAVDSCSVRTPLGPRLVAVGEDLVPGAGSSAAATAWNGDEWTALDPPIGPLAATAYAPTAQCATTIGPTRSMFVMGGAIPPTCDPSMRGLALRILAAPSDLDVDGDVDAGDLAILLGAWLTVGSSAVGDLDRDGVVGASDLAILLGDWSE
ncbi:MAG: hypothetical protein U0572_17610 [Phycisphaerales bacterium]